MNLLESLKTLLKIKTDNIESAKKCNDHIIGDNKQQNLRVGSHENTSLQKTDYTLRED